MEDVKGRLLSLDALRGFNMFFITGGEMLLIAISTFLTGDKANVLATQMTHAKWIGFHFYDLIFPLFVFIAGVTFPFSMASRLARGDSKGAIACNVLRRTVVLFLIGLAKDRIWMMDWDHFFVWNILGRVGIAWGAAAIIVMFFRLRTQVMIFVSLLIGWWLFFKYVPAPGAPAGVNPFFEPRYAFSHYLDIHYLTTAHRYEGGSATIVMVATAMLGVWTGMFLRLKRDNLTPVVKTLCLVAAAAILAFAGVLWAIPQGGCPIAKGAWSSSYVLFAGGLSIGLLALFYWLIDVRGWTRWAFYFRVIGLNALVVYVLAPVLKYGEIGMFFLEPLARLSSDPYWFRSVYFAGMCVIAWLMLYFLYRKKIVIKI